MLCFEINQKCINQNGGVKLNPGLALAELEQPGPGACKTCVFLSCEAKL